VKHVFIVNPVVGQLHLADKLRNELKNIEDIEAYVFASFYAGHESELARIACNTFKDTDLRIYSVGGIGTIHNIINAVPDLSKVEIAFIPAHSTNFIEASMKNPLLFQDIHEIVEGKAFPTDIIKINDNILGLNAFAIGIDSDAVTISNKVREYGFISPKIPYIIGVAHSIAITKSIEYEVKWDGGYYKDYVTEIFFGNGSRTAGGLCFYPSADIHDGKAGFRIIHNMRLREKPKYLKALKANDSNILDAKSVFGDCTRMNIKRTDGELITACIDGNLYKAKDFKIEIQKDAINFVYPTGEYDGEQ